MGTTDTFVAPFGDRQLEFRLRITDTRADGSDGLIDWSFERISDGPGGIAFELYVGSPGGSANYVSNGPVFSDSGTLRLEGGAGEPFEIHLYDMTNTDHTPGTGFSGNGAAIVDAKLPEGSDDGGGGGGDDDPIANPPEAGTIEVADCDAPGTVDAGETAYVSVTVENTGGEQASATVLTSAGGATDETQVSLGPGATQTVVSGFEFDEGGDYAVNAQIV